MRGKNLKTMNEINLSEIEIIPVKPRNGLLAFSSFVLNNSFYVGSVAIYSRFFEDGYRLVYPEKVLANGYKVSCFHPINSQVAKQIEEKIISTYENLIEKAKKKEEVNGSYPKIS